MPSFELVASINPNLLPAHEKWVINISSFSLVRWVIQVMSAREMHVSTCKFFHYHGRYSPPKQSSYCFSLAPRDRASWTYFNLPNRDRAGPDLCSYISILRRPSPDLVRIMYACVRYEPNRLSRWPVYPSDRILYSCRSAWCNSNPRKCWAAKSNWPNERLAKYSNRLYGWSYSCCIWSPIKKRSWIVNRLWLINSSHVKGDPSCLVCLVTLGFSYAWHREHNAIISISLSLCGEREKVNLLSHGRWP